MCSHPMALAAAVTTAHDNDAASVATFFTVEKIRSTKDT